MSDFVAAIDCGTTLVKCAVVGVGGELRGLAVRRSPLARSQDGAVSIRPAALLSTCTAAMRQALANSGVESSRIAALAISNQRATVFPLDAAGQPAGDGLCWQDMRGAAAVRRFRRAVPSARFAAITGLPLDPVFTIGKLLWLRSREPARFRAIDRFALVQDYLLRGLGASGYFCDASNASLTGLMDVASLRWSDSILEAAGLTRRKLPEIVAPATRIGSLSRLAARASGLLEGLPLVAGGGDQQCAGLGSGAVRPGVVALAVGTAAAPLCCQGGPARDLRARVSCCAHAVPGRWELEGLQTAAGACLEWLARLTNARRRFDSSFLDRLDSVPPGSRGLVFLPYLAGASAPRWDPAVSGCLLGARLGHGRPEVARAVLEGVAFQTRSIIDVFTSLGIAVEDVRLSGGASLLPVWNQLQADVLDRPVYTLRGRQAGLLGAAILAATGARVFPSVEEACSSMVQIDQCYAPDPERAAAYDGLYRRQQEAEEGMKRGRVFYAVSREGCS